MAQLTTYTPQMASQPYYKGARLFNTKNQKLLRVRTLALIQVCQRDNRLHGIRLADQLLAHPCYDNNYDPRSLWGILQVSGKVLKPSSVRHVCVHYSVSSSCSTHISRRVEYPFSLHTSLCRQFVAYTNFSALIKTFSGFSIFSPIKTILSSLFVSATHPRWSLFVDLISVSFLAIVPLAKV